MRTFRNLKKLFAAVVIAVAIAGCSKGAETGADSVESLLSRADGYVANQEYAKAEKEYREVLRVAPTNAAALRRLSIIYQEQGQLPQAYPLLKRAAELQPADAEVQLKLGQTLLSLRQLPEARDAALQVLDQQPGQEEALLLLADTALTATSIDEIRALIQTRRQQDQDRAGYHLAFGVLDLRQKEDVRAEGEFKTALNLDPKSAAAHSGLALLYWSRNDLKAAAQEFKAAADLAPARSPLRLRYADFLQKTGAADEAKLVFEELNRKVPDYLPPRVSLMRIACAKQRDEDCTTRVQDILAQDPINFDALLQDGSLNLAKGETAKAIREFEQLSSIYSQNPQVRYQLAVAYLQSAKNANQTNSRAALESAESNLNTAVKLDPRFEQAVLLLAEIKIRKGSPASAVDVLVPLIKERPQVAQAHYMLASAYLAQQDSVRALAVYRQMSDLFPKDPQPPFLTGSILLAQRQLADARIAFEKSVEISPTNLPAIERLVDLDVGEQKFADAMRRAQALIDGDAKLALAWALRGKIYLAQRDFARAEPDLVKAIDLDPNLEPAYILLAQLYVDSNKPGQAIEKLNGLVEKKPTAPALMMLGGIHERAKDYPAARDAYEKVLTIAANNVPALNNLAVLYSEQLGQLDKAYELAKRAKETAPNEPHLSDTFGWILFKKAEYRNALPLLQESAAKLPDQPEIQFHLGMAHYMLGEDGPARTSLEKAVGAAVEFAGKDDARRRLAVLAIPVGAANPGARAELDKYLGEMPDDPAALFRLARLQERNGAVDDAIKTYGKIIDRNPVFAPALRRQAVLYGQRIDDPKTFDLVTKARQAYPDDPEIAKWLGVQNYRREYYARAVDLLKEAALKRNDDPEVLYYLGDAQRQLKQWTECKASLERALSLNLATGFVDKAKASLTECSESAPP